MTAALPIYYGDEAQQALLRRGAQMHLITRADKRYTYYGRAVGAVSPQDLPLPVVMALARLQGNSNYATLADTDVPGLRAEVEAEGLVPMHYARWEGGKTALQTARRCLSQTRLANGYTLSQLLDTTPAAQRDSLAQTAHGCSVLLPSLDVLTGRNQPGVCLMAVAPDGTVAGCAAAASFLHPQHADGKRHCWWGMLAVHPDHRGKAISLTLGAAAMMAMSDTYGFTEFFTGVEPGNAASEAICHKMGLAHEGRSILGMADPALVAGGRMTK